MELNVYSTQKIEILKAHGNEHQDINLNKL